MRFLPKTANDGLIALAISAGPITVTGGTENYKISSTGETVHKTHGPSNAVIDLRFDERLNTLITRGTRLPNTSKGEPEYRITIGRIIVRAVQEKDHWHLVFTSV